MKGYKNIVKINRKKDEGYKTINWSKFVYKKKVLTSFELSNYEKIDSNKQGLNHGRFIGVGFQDEIVSYLKQMAKPMFDKIEDRFIIMKVNLSEKKKSIKKGFFGFFKKEDTPNYQGDKYIYTDIEQCSKEFADFCFSMSFYEVADKEYKFFLGEIKKKSSNDALLAIEKRIYCLLLKDLVPSKRTSREVETLINSMKYNCSLHTYSTVRTNLLVNLYIHLQYEMGNPVSRSMKSDMKVAIKEFLEVKNKPEIKYFSVFFKEQMNRYHLLCNPRNPRKFAKMNTLVGYTFVKMDKIFEDYAKACYIVASKYYQKEEVESWDLIIEFMYHNLGSLYYSNKSYTKCLSYFIKVINNSSKSRAKPSTLIKKVFSKVKEIAEMSRSKDLKDKDIKRSLEISHLIVHELNSLKVISCYASILDEIVVEDKSTLGDFSFTESSIIETRINNSVYSSGVEQAPNNWNLMSIYSKKHKMHYLKKFLKENTSKPVEFNSPMILNLIGCQSVVEKKKLLAISGRTAYVGESIFLDFEFENNNIIEIGNEVFSLLTPIISFNTSKKRFYKFTNNDVIPKDKLSEIVRLIIPEFVLKPGQRKIIRIHLVPLKTGKLRIDGISWMFMFNQFTHHLKTKVGKGGKTNSQFNVFYVKNAIGRIKSELKGIKTEMFFGEISDTSLTLKNETKIQINKIIIICDKPLFTGFSMISFNTPILGLEEKTIDMPIRATVLSLTEIPLMVFYETGGVWRIQMLFFKISIKNSFSMKCISEEVQTNQRLLFVDFLYRKGPAIDANNISIDTVYLLSNAWKLVHDKISIFKKGGNILMYLLIEKDNEPREDWKNLTRDKRKVFIREQNIYKKNQKLEKKKFKQIKSFLQEETLELISDSPKDDLCSDYVDLTVVWRMEDERVSTYGLNSKTNILVKSISSLNKQEKKRNLPKIKIRMKGKSLVKHNFKMYPVCKIKFEVEVDCSNLPSSINNVILRNLEPTQMEEKDGKTYYKISIGEEMFNWLGRNQLVLSRPFKQNNILKLEAQFYKDGIYNLNKFSAEDLEGGGRIEILTENEEIILEIQKEL